MALFKIPKRPGRENDSAIAKKSRSTKRTATVRGGSSVLERITQIKAMVEKHLGKYKDDFIIIRTEEELRQYLVDASYEGVISIDTETTGLDPILDSIVGLCLYTPNHPAAYVPINHVSYVTGVRVDSQLTEEQVAKHLNEFIHDSNHFFTERPLSYDYAGVQIIMFNAKFDIRVIRNQLGVKDIYCTWDAYLAGRLLNENEESKGLKALHQKYVLDGKEDEFKFDALFKGITADKIPISTFYLYAAHDAVITYELYQYQKQFLYYDRTVTPEERNGMNGVSWVFFNIEMPCVSVVCDMEDNGIKFDMNYQQILSEKYNKLVQEKTAEFYKCCAVYEDEIEAYKRNNPNHKLDTPINIGSPVQIAILLYDIIGLKNDDVKYPRSTGEGILQKLDHPITKAILDYREMSKLVSTYIDKLPNCVNPKDGRIHCSFNQYGADTGRFSSSDPNLQNIPSHNKDIRKMFVASTGESILSTDNDIFTVDRWDEVHTSKGWISCSKLSIGDDLGDCIIKSIKFTGDKCVIGV